MQYFKLLSRKFINCRICPVRTLKIHEYAAIDILEKSGIPVPKQHVANSPQEAYSFSNEIAASSNSSDVVVKAQVLAGGRGKGKFSSGLQGGVKIAFDAQEAKNIATQMIGHKIVTKQTGEEGILCSQVSICERLYSRKEFYFAVMLDRKTAGVVLIGSPAGGVDIEEVAIKDPSKIHTMPINITKGFSIENAIEFAKMMNIGANNVEQASDIFIKLYNILINNEATMIEINPFTESKEGKMFCMDCKINFDDNAMFRHENILNLTDDSQTDAKDLEAKKFGLNYISLDGSVGCLVNGAGLAMATMDLIQLHGGKPANFLDVGGGATAEQVTNAFKIILSDDKVQAIFVNIFGGIMKCDIIACGIIEAAKALEIKVPIVVRLEGTNSDQAKAIIAASDFKILPYDNLDEAARMVVKLSEIVGMAKKAEVAVKFELPM